MSFWIWHRRKDGKVGLTGVEFPPMMPIAVVVAAVISAFVLPWPPTTLGVLALVLLGIGFAMILAAKLSTPNRWRLLAFGSAGMSTRMRWLYHLGYGLLGVGAVIIFLFRWIMSA